MLKESTPRMLVTEEQQHFSTVFHGLNPHIGMAGVLYKHIVIANLHEYELLRNISNHAKNLEKLLYWLFICSFFIKTLLNLT